MSKAALLVFYIYAFIFGAVIGSFLNVVAYRLERGISFVKGRSFCPACEHTLQARDLVPVFSWIFLGGKCRYCGAAISPRYAVVELLTGVSAFLCALRYGLSFGTLIVFAAFAALIALSLVDIDTMEIPNGFILFLMIPALASIWVFPETGIWARVIGFFAASVPMALMTLLIKGAFGGGDIKLVAVCGFMLGWKSLLVALFIAILTSGVYAVWLLATKRAKAGAHFAFGPFLSFGIALALLYGDAVVAFYLGLFF